MGGWCPQVSPLGDDDPSLAITRRAGCVDAALATSLATPRQTHNRRDEQVGYISVLRLPTEAFAQIPETIQSVSSTYTYVPGM